MVMKPSPATPFVVAQSKVLLQVLVVALDAPAVVSDIDQFADGRLFGQCGQAVFGGFVLPRWPLDEQPLLRPQPGFASIAPGVAYSHGRKGSSARADSRPGVDSKGKPSRDTTWMNLRPIFGTTPPHSSCPPITASKYIGLLGSCTG